MKKVLAILAAIAAIFIITGCSASEETEKESEPTGQEEIREEARIERSKSVVSLLPKISLTNSKTNENYWYECDQYGNCWDSEGYKWSNCYYNSFAIDCDAGNYWFENTPAEEIAALPAITANLECCDSWGTCYDDLSVAYDDPKYLVANYCDECGNCYDYYGNYVEYNEEFYDQQWCSLYYQYEYVNSWDSCGNSYDSTGEFMFYDNLYYDYEACNEDYSACEAEAFGGPDTLSLNNSADCNSFGDCYDESGDWYQDPSWMKADYCDECGNCYDYYGNYVNYDANLVDDYWCSQYYQYDNVDSWDVCGNSYDAAGEFLFYDNAYYDYKACYGE